MFLALFPRNHIFVYLTFDLTFDLEDDLESPKIISVAICSSSNNFFLQILQKITVKILHLVTKSRACLYTTVI